MLARLYCVANVESRTDSEPTLVIAISDTGMGIPAQALDTHFEEFQQVKVECKSMRDWARAPYRAEMGGALRRDYLGCKRTGTRLDIYR